jgi:hypothetical protein
MHGTRADDHPALFDNHNNAMVEGLTTSLRNIQVFRGYDAVLSGLASYPRGLETETHLFRS